jgi:serine phosphatase RsbU (regulator of sigma subunit)
MYTDGVTEAQDLAGAFFGLERLEPVAAGAALDGGPDIVCGRLRSAVEDFRGEAPPYDDVAVLALRPGRPDGAKKA